MSREHTVHGNTWMCDEARALHVYVYSPENQREAGIMFSIWVVRMLLFFYID